MNICPTDASNNQGQSIPPQPDDCVAKFDIRPLFAVRVTRSPGVWQQYSSGIMTERNNMVHLLYAWYFISKDLNIPRLSYKYTFWLCHPTEWYTGENHVPAISVWKISVDDVEIVRFYNSLDYAGLCIKIIIYKIKNSFI